jgi:hypothetical protein
MQIAITTGKGEVTSLALWEDTIHHTGTCLQVSGSDKAYLVYIPGYDGNALTRLFRLDEGYWRDNSLIDIPPERIKAIDVRYFQNQRPDPSFSIKVFSRDSIRLETLSGTVIENVDTEKLFAYLLNFSNLQSEDISGLLPEEQIRAIIANFHVASIEISTLDSYKYVIDTYLKPLDKQVGDEQFDSNNLYATRDQDNQLVIVSFSDFDLIMRDLQYFTRK